MVGCSARKHGIVVEKVDCFSKSDPAAESRPVRLAKERPAESADSESALHSQLIKTAMR